MKPALLVLAAAFASLPAGAVANKSGKPTVEVMLNKLSAEKYHIGTLTPAVVVTRGRALMIEDEKNFYQIAWGGVHPAPGLHGLTAFDYLPNGEFAGIRGKELLQLQKDGSLKSIMSLPSEGMGIAQGKGKTYLFEREGGEKNALFVFLPNNKGLKLFESPAPINAVLEDGDGILFAVGTGIYRFGADKTTKLVFGLPKGSRDITALAQDPVTKRVYASDGSSVFSFKDKDVIVITRDNGGVLRWFGDGLIILDPKAPLLIRIRGLPS